MLEILSHYWMIILICIGFSAYIAYLGITHRWDKLRKIANKLILQAEKTIVGTKRGQERFEQVLGQLYCLIPAPRVIFFYL